MYRFVINTTSGPVKGFSDGHVSTWLGIPYAGDVSGSRRWTRPQPHEGWTAVRDATQYGPICPQTPAWGYALTAEQSENCLNLNVFSPNASPAKPLPVAVFLHGGGFVAGSGSEPMYNASVIAQRSSMVVVTLNYRLGMLGFLAAPGIAGRGRVHG